MTPADMTLLSYALGVALIGVALVGIVHAFACDPPSERTYESSIYDDYEDL